MEELYVRLCQLAANNLVLVICVIIGFSDFGIMFVMSMGPYKYSKYRQERIDQMKEWLIEYNEYNNDVVTQS